MMSPGSIPDFIVITDTSCLILLDNIDALQILHSVYQNIATTPQVASEYKTLLPDWIKIIPVKDLGLIKTYAQQVDLGEASAIALAHEIDNALLIIDDLKGRRLANELHLKFTGTIGVLIFARQQNKIASLRPYFELIRSTDFRISPILLERILEDFKD